MLQPLGFKSAGFRLNFFFEIGRYCCFGKLVSQWANLRRGLLHTQDAQTRLVQDLNCLHGDDAMATLADICQIKIWFDSIL
jgi:hypothetical protein